MFPRFRVHHFKRLEMVYTLILVNKVIMMLQKKGSWYQCVRTAYTLFIFSSFQTKRKIFHRV